VAVLSIADHPDPNGGGTAFGTWPAASEWSYIARVPGTNTRQRHEPDDPRFVCSQ